MPRPTLKLTKPRDPAAASKPASTRARLAQRERQRSAPPAIAPATELPQAEPAPPPAQPVPAPRQAKPRPASKGGPPRERSRNSSPAAPRDAKPRGGPRQTRRPDAAKPQSRAPDAPRAATRRPPQAPRTEAPRPPQAPRIMAPSRPDEPRLSKRMAELGLCSRREADEWIESGWVRVDGKVVDQLGARVRREAAIEVDPAARRHQAERVTIILHKPVGYVSGQPEDGHQSAVVLVKPENRWIEDPSPLAFRPMHLRDLAPAGRLDIDSTGLLVYTQDGRIARRLIGADSEVEKEYLVRVEGKLPEGGLERLRHGVELDGVKLKPAKVSWSNEDQLRFVLREGRKRQIRRMCEAVGLVVTGLKRVRSGGVPLGRLPLGQWRYLRPDERF